jgi:hypothetical protein
MTADKILSPDQRQRSEITYCSAVEWLYHLQSSLFISLQTSNSKEIYNPVPFANKAYQFQHKYLENRDLIVWPVITYIYFYVGYFTHPASLTFQKPFCSMAETELKVTQDLE